MSRTNDFYSIDGLPCDDYADVVMAKLNEDYKASAGFDLIGGEIMAQSGRRIKIKDQRALSGLLAV